MNFYETVMGRKFFEGDVPQIRRHLADLTCTIDKLCDLLDPENTVDTLVPAKYLDKELSSGAKFVNSLEISGHTFCVVRKRKETL